MASAANDDDVKVSTDSSQSLSSNNADLAKFTESGVISPTVIDLIFAKVTGNALFVTIQPKYSEKRAIQYAGDTGDSDSANVVAVNDKRVFLLVKDSGSAAFPYRIKSTNFDTLGLCWFANGGTSNLIVNNMNAADLAGTAQETQLNFSFAPVDGDDSNNLFFQIQNEGSLGIDFMTVNTSGTDEGKFSMKGRSNALDTVSFLVKLANFSSFSVQGITFAPKTTPDHSLPKRTIPIMSQTLENYSNSPQIVSFEFIRTLDTKFVFDLDSSLTLLSGNFSFKALFDVDNDNGGLTHQELFTRDGSGLSTISNYRGLTNNITEWSSNPSIGGTIKFDVTKRGSVSVYKRGQSQSDPGVVTATLYCVSAPVILTLESATAMNIETGVVKVISGDWKGNILYNPTVTFEGDIYDSSRHCSGGDRDGKTTYGNNGNGNDNGKGTGNGKGNSSGKDKNDKDKN